MKKKYIVTTKEVHTCDYAVIAENAEDAKKKVDAGDGEPVCAQSDPFLYRLGMDEMDVRLYAPITSITFPKGGRV